MTEKKPRHTSDKERRSVGRTPIRIWAKETSGNMTSFHLVSNISHTGLHIDKKLPLPMGAKINLELELTQPYGKIQVKGIVNNTYKDSDSNVMGTGVEFVEITEVDNKTIDDYLKQMKSKSRKV